MSFVSYKEQTAFTKAIERLKYRAKTNIVEMCDMCQTNQASNMSAELPAKYAGEHGEWAVGLQRTLLQVVHSKAQLVPRTHNGTI